VLTPAHSCTEASVRGYENEVLESLKGGQTYSGGLQYARGIKSHSQKNGAYILPFSNIMRTFGWIMIKVYELKCCVLTKS